ncbi:long-chain fatty acid--CoA ligase [Streptomyces thermolineatus]|uniref:Long-chain fatty acid--CoA ligase n=1 Tax=Streptomyces thermolineatus TaxID=44033 RepID=A0ABP6A2S8_9ACTN|nr:long-chain fatty acid--CoA ligase [Streptomyces sp. HB2AG]MCZ2525946.1 long-chain fatty acid--CoA ligase [Streptomyces sp. HB2AG]
MTNLALNLVRTAAEHPERPAIRFGESVYSYAELDGASARVAGALVADGLRPGDRVAVMLPNVPAVVALYYGVMRAGGVVVPMNPLLKAREVEHYLSDSGASRLLVADAFAAEAALGAEAVGTPWSRVGGTGLADELRGGEPVAEPVEKDGDDSAVILYTSGTTGRPKGAELTHANLTHNVRVVTGLFSMTPQDVVMGCLPLFHTFGQCCAMNASILGGACLVLIPRFDPAQVLGAMEQHKVTVFQGVPTMYNALLHQPGTADTGSLRMCVSGGAALPVEVLRGFEERFDCMVLEGFGMSETSPVVTFNHPDRPRKAGSIGTPIEGVEVRLVAPDGSDVPQGEVGEIAIRGYNVMKGYWNAPQSTAEAIPDGWFRSGDLARQDEDGYFFVVDRKKDMIIRGGYNVYPRELEEVLNEHPDVVEAAVLGVPHAELGEEVAAAVVVRPGSGTGAEELRAYVKERVAAYKYPRHVRLLDTLPKGATGKILKREIDLGSPAGA